MNVNKRDRRGDTAGDRGAGQRTPRSGGRIAAQRATHDGVVTGNIRRDARARGAREYATSGSVALAPQDLKVWDSSAEPDQTPALKVAPPPPVSVPRAPFVALILVVVVGGVLGILLVNTKINENAFRISKLQDQQATLDIQQQQLEKRIANYEAPGNLAAEARRLGLVESGPPAFIRLPDGRVIGVPQPARGQQAITSQQSAGR